MANITFSEPQWNPSVENQAVARALRIGQAQPVLVTRYVVNQTVELVSAPHYWPGAWIALIRCRT